MDDTLYELPEQIELALEEYRALNAGLEAGLEACDRMGDQGAAALRDPIEAALRLLAYRIWPELRNIEDKEQ